MNAIYVVNLKEPPQVEALLAVHGIQYENHTDILLLTPTRPSRPETRSHAAAGMGVGVRTS